MNTVVKVESLVKLFGNFKAVDSIDFEVYKGEIFGFLGANGAGKSTTIRILCGIQPPSSGKVMVMGYDALNEAFKIKQNIGYMSQKFTLYDDLTVNENIEFFAGIRKISNKDFEDRKNKILELSELQGKEKLVTRSLPGGWKQKLALGCSIIHNPQILFLDEPTAGVDPAARKIFWEIIYQLRKMGTTIFVTSHYMDEVEQCDRIALMHKGKIVALGSPEELKKNVIKGSLYNLQCDKQKEVKEVLSEIPGIERMDPFGRGFHIILENNNIQLEEEFQKSITKKLNSLSIQIIQFNKTKPNLEDVFVYLIGNLEEK